MRGCGRTEGDVVGLELALVGVVGVGERDHTVRLPGRAEGAVVDSRNARAERDGEGGDDVVAGHAVQHDGLRAVEPLENCELDTGF